MTGSPRDLDWPTRRWLLWGLAAVGGLILIVAFFIWLGSEEAEPVAEVGDQFEWSIVLVDQTGDTVTLKGDEPLGRPTETWQNDFQVSRDLQGSFEWDTDAGLPADVVEIDAIEGCEELNVELGKWVDGIGAAEGDAFNWRARAFTQYTLDKMRTDGCEVNEDELADLIAP